jgi:hypothetical protein
VPTIVHRLKPGFVLLLAAAALAAGAEKKIQPATAGNEYLDLTATAILEKAGVEAALGADPAADMLVIELTFAPKGDHVIAVSRDDFTLLSRKDGQRSQPLHPSQVAGGATLVVASEGRGGIGGGVVSQRRGPVWGGVPGTGDRPRRVGGDDDAVVRSGGSEATTAVKNETGKENPILAVLKTKELPQTKTNAAVSGLLYFFLEGKHKLKDLELIYKGPAGTLTLDFQK